MFDLLIVPLLLWRRTRPLAFIAALLFHFTNDRLFVIGIFPWFMMAATAIYFPPDWPRRLLHRLRLAAWPIPVSGIAPTSVVPTPLNGRQRLLVALLVVYAAAQCALPLRHLLYEGDPAWTEEGHRYSWRMKLRSKSGRGVFLVQHPASGETWEINSADYLPNWQNGKMLTHPHMILQFAHYLHDGMAKAGYEDVAVYAQIRVALNGRARQPFIDPTVNLAAQTYSLRPSSWVLPLTTPLRP